MDAQGTDVVVQAMQRLGIAAPRDVRGIRQLTGGVSSDIWRIDLPGRSICAKRALPTLKVAALWQAPLSRNQFEYDWYRTVAPKFAHAMPAMLGRDEPSGIFFMTFLDPAHHPVWKQQLLNGQIDGTTAGMVGQTLGGIHAFTAGDATVAARFQSDQEFFSLRIEPYLLATGLQHPDLAGMLNRIAETTRTTRLALVHGDVSPKNILCGPGHPVFLDAECAWYGDPAFDLAFCLNHLLLKAVFMRQHAAALLDSFATLYQAYLPLVHWEDRAGLEARCARLLPALFLARVDGKSPVEYLTDAGHKDTVRQLARSCLQAPHDTLASIQHLITTELTP